MARSLARKKRRGHKKKAAESIASSLTAQLGKEGKFSSFLTLANPIISFLSTQALSSVLKTAGITIMPWLAPLVFAYTAWETKRQAEKLFREKGKMGADPSKVVSGSKYSYGEKEAKTYRETLESDIEATKASPESLAAEIGLSYVASMIPKVGIVDKVDPDTGEVIGSVIGVKPADLTGKDFKGVLKPHEGGWVSRADTGLFGTEVSGAKGVQASFSPEKYESYKEAIESFDYSSLGEDVSPKEYEDLVWSRQFGSKVTDAPFGTGETMSDSSTLYEPKDAMETSYEGWFGGGIPEPEQKSKFMEWLQKPNIRDDVSGGGTREVPHFLTPEDWYEKKYDPIKEAGEPFQWSEGGRVPKYYGGGNVSDSRTISDYFNMKGSTLGGSNTESLTEMLGRK